MIANKICFTVCLMLLGVFSLNAQNLKSEEIISKHLDSIGKEEKRKELKNMMLLGLSQFESKMPQRKSLGKVAIVSDTSNLLFISSFAAENYPYEKIGNFGGKVNIPFVLSGIRSPLGDFLWEHPSILKGGLFSGSMSLKWLFLDENFKKGKFSSGGIKKVDGRKAYVVEYFTEGTSDEFKIRLFFDTETFQHIRSEYREDYSGKQVPFSGQNPNNTTLGQINGYVMQLVEDFSDFKTYEGLTLPSLLKVKYFGTSSKGTYEYDWTFTVNDVKFNQTLKENFFNF